VSFHFGIEVVAVVVFAAASVAVLVIVTEAITGAVTGVNAYVTPGGVNAFGIKSS
jgi:hypothetical protein